MISGSGKMELAGELVWSGFSDVEGKEATLWKSEWKARNGGKQTQTPIWAFTAIILLSF